MSIGVNISLFLRKQDWNNREMKTFYFNSDHVGSCYGGRHIVAAILRLIFYNGTVCLPLNDDSLELPQMSSFVLQKMANLCYNGSPQHFIFSPSIPPEPSYL